VAYILWLWSMFGVSFGDKVRSRSSKADVTGADPGSLGHNTLKQDVSYRQLLDKCCNCCKIHRVVSEITILKCNKTRNRKQQPPSCCKREAHAKYSFLYVQLQIICTLDLYRRKCHVTTLCPKNVTTLSCCNGCWINLIDWQLTTGRINKWPKNFD